MSPPSNGNDSGGDQSGENGAVTDIVTHVLSDIDDKFNPLGCLGHGSFGSVYLAEKKTTSKRKVALKIMRLDPTDEEDYETFTRELDAVVTLNDNSNTDQENDPRSQHIVFFEDWFVGPNFACIVMKHADGGTLSSLIKSKAEQLLHFHNNHTNSPQEKKNIMKCLFSERRIAWYASQLCDALSYAHSRGVAHHDIKSSNVLINGSSGGKLLLADFGSALKPGEEAVGFTRSFAPPELLASHELEDYSSLQPDKIDAFGLGCILYELLTCRELQDNSGEDETLAQYISRHGLDAAMDHQKCLKLPWLPEEYNSIIHLNGDCNVPLGARQFGYSHALRSLTKTLLEPNPAERWLPSQLQDPFKKDPRSPLLTPTVYAAQITEPGDIITLDNVQLGMLVMRGPDWNDTENGKIDEYNNTTRMASVGVVVELDPDALFCTVAFPDPSLSSKHEPTFFRIGSENKFELIAAPTPMKDFCSGKEGENRWNGLVLRPPSSPMNSEVLGHRPNEHCQIVGVDNKRGLMLVAPIQAMSLPPNQPFDCFVESPSFAGPQRPLAFPEEWQSSFEANGVQLVELPNDSEERTNVMDQLHSMEEGGLDRARFRVSSVKRVQNKALWKKYSNAREKIALENWGIANVQRLFHGFPTNTQNPPEMHCLMDNFLNNNLFNTYVVCSSPRLVHRGCSRGSSHEWRSYRKSERQHIMFLSRVVLGREYNRLRPSYTARNGDGIKYHSWLGLDSGDDDENKYYNCPNMGQLYPEYIITYSKLIFASSRQSQEDAVSSRLSSLSIRRGQTSSSGGSAANSVPRRILRASRQGSGLVSGAGNKGMVSASLAPTTMMTANANASVSTLSSSPRIKECVICMSKPVQRILIPCGHPCLCDDCSSDQVLERLRRRGGCPECRTPFTQTAKFYGKILMDD